MSRKYIEIAELLQQRLLNGDYPDGRRPSLRKLATDMGCSYMTAVRSIQYLDAQAKEPPATSRPLVAMITPQWKFSVWHRELRNTVLQLGGQLRFIAYSGIQDPAITEGLNSNFDLVLLDCRIPENSRLFEVIYRNRDRAVAMFQDLTAHGIRSISGAPCSTIGLIIAELAGYGIRNIDMIGDRQMRFLRKERVDTWRRALRATGSSGVYHGYEHQEFENEEVEAYRYLKQTFSTHRLPQAFFCCTPASAQGLYRFCWEHGIQVGRDISVFSFGGEDTAEMMNPPLATVINTGLPELLRALIHEYVPGAKRTERLFFQLTEQNYTHGASLALPGDSTGTIKENGNKTFARTCDP